MSGKFVKLSVVLAAGVALASFAAPAAAKEFRVAFLAASSQNGFNQAIYEGVKKRAEKIGGISVEISTASSTPPSSIRRSRTSPPRASSTP